METLGIPLEKCWINIDRYGNTSAPPADHAGRSQPHRKAEERRRDRHDGDRRRHDLGQRDLEVVRGEGRVALERSGTASEATRYLSARVAP